MNLRRCSTISAVAVAMSITITGASSAGEPVDDPLATVPATTVETPLAVSTRAPLPSESDALNMPRSALEIVALTRSEPWTEVVDQVQWDEQSATLTIYAINKVDALANSLGQPEGLVVEVLSPVLNSSEVEDRMKRLVDDRGFLEDGQRISGWYSAPNGAFATVGLPPEVPLEDLPTEIDGLELRYEEGVVNEPAVRATAIAPVVGGMLMSSGSRSCTTGMPIGFGEQLSRLGNLSADHCGSGTGQEWVYGSPSSASVVGRTSGVVSALPGSMVTDLERYVDGESLAAAMAWGSHNNFTYVPINGYYSAAIGQSVCYNGAFSGVQCGSVVEATNAVVCYPSTPALPCYQVTRTAHPQGIAVAGNGDSGGPVGTLTGRPSDNRTGFYGVGIISGIQGGTSTCNGVPGSSARRCSSVAFFAPVARMYEEPTDWRLLVAR